ncbi:NAD(P)-binding protein [Aulographum hederae CBS 113979]|uniref:NAD(P)-binding protein n=1 Tax=Aulographum hederae CBS 113979 TaxID=1176131 RepID=A0A6G1HGX6_9PEZI|nr:NAD(P)-binding protein [Aulographum hederae CBS 113979]
MSSVYTSKLHNTSVLIFGGTSGIGFAVASACLSSGATVTISGSNPKKLSTASTRLQTSIVSPGSLSIFPCDLGDPTTLEDNLLVLLKAVTDDGAKKLDHVIFTAGNALSLKPLGEISAADIQAAQTVRFTAPLLLAKHLPTYLTVSADSSFTVTGGVNTTKPMPSWVVPCCVGAAIEGLTRSLAVDMAPARVNCVAPGAVKTELFEGIGEELQERFREGTLVKRLGRPEDVAEAYLYLVRDGFVTGTVLGSNGGSLLKY